MPAENQLNEAFAQTKRAYLLLKCEVYGHKHNLRLRERLAEFDSAPGLEHRLRGVAGVVLSPKPEEHSEVLSWLKEISYVILPKTVEPSSAQSKKVKEQERFFTNEVTDSVYKSKKVNYFFDGPIELHILSVMWILSEGRYLDEPLGKECAGIRVHESVHQQKPEIRRLFRSYAPQYAAWRDGAIQAAQRLLKKENQAVCVLSLDFASFFYCLQPDFKEIAAYLRDARITHPPVQPSILGSLLPIIEAICQAYRSKARDFLRVSHPTVPSDCGIPLEISFSPILANWSLRLFDKEVLERRNPFYYCRYVDDLLFVLPPFGVSEADPLEGVLRVHFEETRIIRRVDDTYEVISCTGARLQKAKCILHHFDPQNSVAGLENFAKRIEQLSSDFQELPDSEIARPFKEIAWELLYDGSQYKWRSVTGIGEDKNELAQFLHKNCMIALFTDPQTIPEASRDLETFFKGTNGLQYHDLWERLFTLLALTADGQTAKRINSNLELACMSLKYAFEADPAAGSPTETIAAPGGFSEILSKHLQTSLKRHLLLCRAMAQAAAGVSGEDREEITEKALKFQRSRLVRHYFTRISDQADPARELISQDQAHSNAGLSELFPWFVSFEELMIRELLSHSGSIDASREFESVKAQFKQYNKMELIGVTVTIDKADA